MKKFREDLPIRAYFPQVLLLALLGAGVFLARSIVYDYLVDPLARSLWLAVRLVQTLDQEVAWTLLVCATVLAGLRILLGAGGEKPPSAYAQENPGADRMAFWEAQLRLADNAAAHRPALQASLQGLIDAVADLGGGDEKIEINLPAPKAKSWQLILLKARRRLERGRPNRSQFQDKALERNLAQILDSLESEMETANDPSVSHPQHR